jgi:hypothetical protein
MVQAKQALLATIRVSLTVVPFRFSYWSNCPSRKLRVGRPPKACVMSIVEAVPRSVNDMRPGLSCMSSRIFQTAFMKAAGSATRTPPVPRTAMALRFFEPITAPTPLRPAARCLSFMMQAKRTSFSPPGPMQATRRPGIPSSRRSPSSVSPTSRPQ